MMSMITQGIAKVKALNESIDEKRSKLRKKRKKLSDKVDKWGENPRRKALKGAFGRVGISDTDINNNPSLFD